MAKYRITAPDGGTYEITAPDDASQEQVMAYAQANYAQTGAKAPAQSATQPQRSLAGELARQVGLTGRYALEGGAQILDLPGAAIRAGLGAMGVKSDLPSESAGKLADFIGLPKPGGGLESAVAAATRGGFGAAVPAGLASQAARGTTGTAQGILQGLAANPAAQIGGGAGSGAASDAARQAGASEYGQFGAGLVGGVAGGALGNAAMKQAGRVGEALAKVAGADTLPASLTPKKMSDVQLSQVLRNRLSITGGDWDAIPGRVQASLMADVRKANSLENLDARAVQRLADFRALEVTPTRGTVTLDPVQLTREKNLAKSGANSRLGSAQGLARVENENNAQLVRLMQQLEGGASVDPVQAGRTLSGNITGQRDALRSAEQAAWDAAKASPGYRMPMQAHVLGDINAALGESGMMPFMDGRISAYMQALQQSPDQFTPQAYRNLHSMLSKAMSSGGNEAATAGIARKVLEGAEMRPSATQIPNPGNLPVTGQAAGILRATDPMPGDAMGAIDAARRATKAAYAFEDSSPLVRKVLSDGAMGDPARIGKHILNATPDEAREIARHLGPQEMQTIRGAIATHIKQKALNGASDEVGNVSQKALNSAINAMGREKLSLFFSPEDVQQLERMGRVASYVQAQPSGSAVNNSNSGALMVGKGIDLLTGISSKIPLLNIDEQIDSLVNWRGSSNALQAQRGILASPAQASGLLQYGNGNSAGRGLAMGGLLAIPQDAERAKHDQRK